MSPHYNFQCPSKHKFNELALPGTKYMKCDCGKAAKRTYDEMRPQEKKS
jgi:hypothetical protein